jgi:hypothetical protein
LPRAFATQRMHFADGNAGWTVRAAKQPRSLLQWS